MTIPTTLELKVKRLNPSASLPTYAKNGDAGLDLTAHSVVSQGEFRKYGTGIAIEIPEGYVGLMFPRSSIYKYDLSLSNSVGVIDSGYRGELKVNFRLTKSSDEAIIYKVGERIGQLIILPYPFTLIKEVTELSDSKRGTFGFGSSGT